MTITRVEFRNFKALSNYSLSLGKMNILVGPNNSGKSTILSAFRVLAAGIRKANARSADLVRGPEEFTSGHYIPMEDIPISLENVHTNYDTNVATTVTFHIIGNKTLTLYFPSKGNPVLIPESGHRPVKMPSLFKKEFPIRVDSVPVLGPVEHMEQLVNERTVQIGLATHRASRHFRNYWYYFPTNFDLFANKIRSTWDSMDIEPPSRDEEFLSMFCREAGIKRELYWSGFGFQVWCQLITHIIRAAQADILIVDEPEIYLHPDLQRRLLSVLRETGPSIILATHSTEIVSEADPSEILIVDKSEKSAYRLRNLDQVQDAIERLGSNQNIILTQLARTQHVLFVEGEDFKILSRFASQLGLTEVAAKFGFTVVQVGGFSHWGEVKALAKGIEKVLGRKLMLGAVFDRDYKCDEEVAEVLAELQQHLQFAHIHDRKEIENYW